MTDSTDTGAQYAEMSCSELAQEVSRLDESLNQEYKKRSPLLKDTFNPVNYVVPDMLSVQKIKSDSKAKELNKELFSANIQLTKKGCK